MGRYDELAKDIEDIISNSNIEEDPIHSKSVLELVIILNPDATEEEKIAALGHDIERGVYPRLRPYPGESYEYYKQRHAERSSRILGRLMKKYGYDPDSVEKVKLYVRLHEVGGCKEADNIRDADSISYFQYNINFYYKRHGLIDTIKRGSLMYERSSQRAKEIIGKLDYAPEIRKVMEQVNL
jgi:hypothetical protein